MTVCLSSRLIASFPQSHINLNFILYSPGASLISGDYLPKNEAPTIETYTESHTELSKKFLHLSKNLAFLVKNKKYLYTPRIPEEIIGEYSAVLKSIEDRRRKLKRVAFPRNFELRPKCGLFLYYLIREKRPKVVLETGVGNGFGTEIILSALDKNKKGVLYSIDVYRNVGNLVSGTRNRWKFIVGNPRKTLIGALNKIDNVDVFLHDSDHSYENMKFEFSAILPKTSKGSVILGDDACLNNAFMEMARSVNKDPQIIADYRRSFGILEL
jgi:predicted O-methyltransferase YrrM